MSETKEADVKKVVADTFAKAVETGGGDIFSEQFAREMDRSGEVSRLVLRADPLCVVQN